MSNTDKAIAYINVNSLTGIKAGKDRTNFLEIWMVVVEGRIFARSWGFAERSWYNTFLKEPSGQIKCGEQIFDITAVPVVDDAALSEKINRAYLEKYNHGENAFYAKRIVEPGHVDKTMEFVIVQSQNAI